MVDVAIVQPELRGHRLRYVQVLVKHLTERSISASILTSGFNEDQLLRSLAATTHAANIPLSVLKLGRTEAVGWCRLANTHPSGRIVFPDGDVVLRAALFNGPPPDRLSLLVMRPWDLPGAGATFSPKNLTKSWLARWLASCGATVGLLRQASATFRCRNTRLLEVADPVPDTAAGWEESQFPVGTNILLAGTVGPRKHPIELAAAIGQLAREGSDMKLRIAGRLHYSTAAAFRAYPARNIEIDDRWLTEKELQTEILRASLVACVHDNPGSSGLVALAMSRGVPVLVTGRGEPEVLVRRTGAGVVAPSASVRDLTDALRRADEQLAQLRRAARAAAPMFKGTEENFAQALLGDSSQ